MTAQTTTTAPAICACCPDPTRPGLLTCSPRCAITLVKTFAATVSRNR